TFFEHKRAPRSPLRPSLARFPRVAIIVPCYNEEKSLAGTVSSLLALAYPKDKLEIIVVDDGSTDNTLSVTRSFADSRVRVITKENGGKHTALNAGLAATGAEIVGCLDADSFVAPDALIDMAAQFEAEDVMAVTPGIKAHNPRTLIQLIQKVEYEMAIFLRKMFGLLNAQYVTPGPFSLYRREVFAKVGTFKQGYNTEDMEMALRIRANHFRIENMHTAHVHTITPATFSALYRQRLRWVSGFLNNVLRDYRHLLFSIKHGHLGLFSLPGALLSIAMVLYLVGYTVFSLATKIAEKYIEMSNVNFEILWSTPSVDWFFINTGSVLLLSIILFSLMAVIVFLGRHLSRERLRLSRDVISFLLLYGFIAPIWIGMSVYRVARGKDLKW
ncbi:glycosyltransferase family 2 protein, partial [candidate division KSB1 bacterium]|nr:glycosyltransferase family 2 protein [candidate division KSB1 bacterium]NIT75158.1 glycosyltransferase family 2 protein [candidate division KSB1 bacterium]NIW73476.1 glycosyltransferase [candidate division KSB1 bacterium]NIX74838.1 glycosyltransferase [candidate division KSB1 bacterium]